MIKVVCWWSGGVTSAVACKIAIDLYGLNNCRIIFIDTKNEHDDTYRFFKDCEKWYGKTIETISAIGDKYESIEDVWYDFNSLNVAHGAICSSELKRQVRIDWQRKNEYLHQVFGFDIDEPKRAKNIKKNYPISKPIFPLLLHGLTKQDTWDILRKEGIKPPEAYELGFSNNNCLKTGCVQGGVSYWKRYRDVYPERFEAMGKREHELTELKGKPVTCLKDQSKGAKKSGLENVFLIRNPNYPKHKTLDDMKGRDKEPIGECNGFCGIQTKLFNNQ